MSDLSDLFIQPEGEGAEEPQGLSELFAPPEDLDRSPLALAMRDRRYEDMLYNLALADLASEQPQLGDATLYSERADQLLDQLVEGWGVPGLRLSTQALDDLPDFMERNKMPQPSSRLARLGMNTLGSIAGAFEFLQIIPDATMTFTANLAEVQSQRDERDLGFEAGPIDAQEGTAGGSPAGTPWQAAGEMWEAANLTSEQLELGGAQGFRGWLTYSPSVYWRGEHLWGRSPYEEDNSVRGTDIVRRFGLDARFGIQSDAGREWLGLGVEIFMDPLTWVDVMYAGAKVVGTMGRATGSAKMVADANRMERMAGSVYRAITPRGVAEAAAGAANALSMSVTGQSTGVVDMALGILNRGMNAFLDLPAPDFFVRASQRAKATAGTFGFLDAGTDISLAPRWRDVFAQDGSFAWLPGPRPAWLSGAEDTGLSAGQVGVGYRNEIQKIGLRAIQGMGEAMTSGLPQRKFTLRLPWARVAVAGASSLDPNYYGYVRALGAAVSDWLDTAALDASVKANAGMMQRLEALSGTYNIPLEETLGRFNQTVNAGRRAIIQTGYETSGYRVFIEAMRNASYDVGVDYNDMRRAYEQLHGGIDLQQMELDDYFHFVKPGSTGASPATAASRQVAAGIVSDIGSANPSSQVQDFQAWVTRTNEILEEMGYAHLRGITPQQFLEGTMGYLRRTFQGVQDPKTATTALLRNDIIVMQEVNAIDTAELLGATFGHGVEDDVLQYLMAITPSTPRGRVPGEDALAMHFQTDDLARLLSQKVGREVTGHELAKVIYSHDPNAQYLSETLDTIADYVRNPATSGTGGTPWAQTPATFQGRQDLDPEYLVRLLVETDPLARVAEVTGLGGRQVMAQELLGTAWKNLVADGFVIPGDQLRQMDFARAIRADNMAPMTVDGVRYAIMPDNPRIWGPFAGNAIPEDVARSMVRVLSAPNVTKSSWERMLGMWRQMLISPLPTSLRNVIGNFLLIQQAGGDLTDMFQALPRAMSLRNQFLKTGRLPDEFRGYEHLFGFIQDESTMTASALRSAEEMLTNVASGQRTVGSVLQGPQEFIQWATQGQTAAGTATRVGLTLGGTGALGLFRYGEEVTRITAFLTKHDELLRAGKSFDEAVQRAAHFATNSAYNYAALPGLPDLMRRTGVSAFPQFAYFTAGRTPRVIAENPLAPLRVEYLRRAFNVGATDGDMREQERLTQMVEGYQRYSNPMAIPIRGEDGRYRVFDLQYFFPQGSNPLDLVFDPFTFPAVTPLVDSIYAWTEGSGEGYGPFSARFGRRVFDPHATTAERAGQTAEFVGSQYVFPGVWRSYERAMEGYAYSTNSDMFDLWGMATARSTNLDPEQIIGRQFGVNLRNVSTRITDPRFRQELANLNSRHQVKLDSALNAWTEEIAIRGVTDRSVKLRERYLELQNEAQEELRQFLRVMGP